MISGLCLKNKGSMMIGKYKLNISISAITKCVKSQNYELEMYQLRNLSNWMYQMKMYQMRAIKVIAFISKCQGVLI